MSAENNIIYDNYKKLTEDEKLEFIIKIITNDKQSLRNIIHKNMCLIQELICSDDVVICLCHFGFIIKDMQYVCSGCGQNCCFTCMYNTINNTKLRGWYCCRNIECQKMYDDDESV